MSKSSLADTYGKETKKQTYFFFLYKYIIYILYWKIIRRRNTQHKKTKAIYGISFFVSLFLSLWRHKLKHLNFNFLLLLLFYIHFNKSRKVFFITWIFFKTIYKNGKTFGFVVFFIIKAQYFSKMQNKQKF